MIRCGRVKRLESKRKKLNTAMLLSASAAAAKENSAKAGELPQ